MPSASSGVSLFKSVDEGRSFLRFIAVWRVRLDRQWSDAPSENSRPRFDLHGHDIITQPPHLWSGSIHSNLSRPFNYQRLIEPLSGFMIIWVTCAFICQYVADSMFSPLLFWITKKKKIPNPQATDKMHVVMWPVSDSVAASCQMWRSLVLLFFKAFKLSNTFLWIMGTAINGQ